MKTEIRIPESALKFSKANINMIKLLESSTSLDEFMLYIDCVILNVNNFIAECKKVNNVSDVTNKELTNENWKDYLFELDNFKDIKTKYYNLGGK